LDIDIEDNGDGTFSIYYTVKDAGDYTLSVKFGGQPVPDGFYTFTVSAVKVHYEAVWYFPHKDDLQFVRSQLLLSWVGRTSWVV
jgi:hypothetical protein